MVESVDLLNLDVGGKLGNVIRPQLEGLRFGPFRIVFYEDYERRVSQLTQQGQLQSRIHMEGSRLTVEERIVDPSYADGWIATARLLIDGSNAESSVLAEQSIPDSGIWDLCELLTFFTGRRVTVSQYCERHGAAYRHVGRGCKMYFATLHMVAHAWPHRSSLVQNDLEMAFLSHNQAVYDMIQTQVSHYTTALDIICAHYPVQTTTGQQQAGLTRSTKRALKEKVQSAVAEVTELLPAQREAFIRVLGARVDQGLAKGFVTKLEDLLVEFGAVDPNPTDEVRNRIRFVDTLRNAVIHNGRLPRADENESRQQLGQRVAQFSGQVLPSINAAAFYRLLGFDQQARDQFALETPELRDFFVNGDLGPTINDISDLRILERLLGSADMDANELASEEAFDDVRLVRANTAAVRGEEARDLVASLYDQQLLARLRELVRDQAYHIHRTRSELKFSPEADWFQARQELGIPADLWL